MRLTVVADPPDNAVREIAAMVTGAARAPGLDALVGLLDGGDRVTTIDLVAHANSDGVMRLGASLVDPDDPAEAATFDRLAGALARHGVTTLRLLGCRTAHGRGSRIIVTLAERFAIAVYGSTTMLLPRHYDADGFRAEYEVLLAHDRVLRQLPLRAR